ncbi:MAG TPA: site-specific integrase [Terriglobales bacterium]|nr:site-specific integrase [Terriglobales bacterium]
MSIYKRGSTYWYKFQWQGLLIRESTKQGNDKIARNMESAHRTSLAQGLVGIREKKRTTVAQFIKDRFEPWAKGAFEKSSPQTWKSWYRPSIRAIEGYAPLCKRVLSDVTSEHAADFAAHIRVRGAKGKPLQASSVNARLRVLRRMFHLAVEWGELENAPKIKLLPGERHRERVLAPEEESRYLAAATSLLADVATVLIDSGMRPEECFRQRWENVTWVNGRHGSMLVTHGKTKAARRVIPMTPRVRMILEQRWEAADKPEEGWMWPGDTKSGHIEPSTLKKQHRNALKLSKVRPFVLYSLRHTFLTRLGASGCDVWTLARIAGHSSIAMSYRYVHPSEDRVLDAMELLGGHKSGHSEETGAKEEVKKLQEANENSAA